MVSLTKILRNVGIGVLCLGAANSVSYYATKYSIENTPKSIRKEKAERILDNYESLYFTEKPVFYGTKIAAFEYNDDSQEKKYGNFSENSDSKENISYRSNN